MLICPFCNRECFSKRSFAQHSSRCKLNPQRIDPSTWLNGSLKGRKSWNAGLSGDPRLKHSDESKALMRERAKERTPEWHKENGLRISTAINKKVDENTWHTSVAKKMHINYKGADLHGTWELKYAEFLDKNKIEWVRNTKQFSYIFQDKNRKYTPDFYLPTTNEYVEIKGYKTEKDEAKWLQFPVDEKLIILMGKDLKELGII